MDSNDRERVSEARDELHRMLNEVTNSIHSQQTRGIHIDFLLFFLSSFGPWIEVYGFSFQDELRYATLLVFANKQDLPNAMSVSEITDKLGLQSLRQRRWYIYTYIYA